MSFVLSGKKYTIEDYIKLDDNRRYELIGGELIVVPSPRPRHQKIGAKLIAQIGQYLEQYPLGEIYHELDVQLGDNIVSPDILFISKERLNIVGEMNVQGAPDLVIEILSPSTANYDKKKKSWLYYSSGVKEYWLVDPDIQLVEVFVTGEKNWQWIGVFDQEDILDTSLLPELKLELKKVFDVLK